MEMTRKRPPGAKASHQPNKKAKISRKKRSGFDDEIFSETNYYIKNGLRYVQPYYFTFTTHAKGRWVGSNVYDVFCKEFQAERPEYYDKAIKAGKVSVNGKVVSMDTVIGQNDLICHTVHRHEPPITSQELKILHEDRELVVVNKPASIPIHPCGRYRHNTIVFLLGKEHNLSNLHTVHRLDRLTSGVLILAKTVERAQKLEVEIRERKVTKEYVCRVQGEFPCSPVSCCEPILVFSHKLGLSRVDPEGKPCTTHFTRLSYNGETSVVQCFPKTGRMHQIRVHLQWLGYPILNDPLYNHPVWKRSGRETCVSGGGGGRGGEGGGEGIGNQHSMLVCPSSDLENIVSKIVESKFVQRRSATNIPPETKVLPETNVPPASVPPETNVPPANIPPETNVLPTNIPPETNVPPANVPPETNVPPANIPPETNVPPPNILPESPGPSDTSLDKDCTECHLLRPDPTPNELMMYLHALSYKGEDWSFSTTMPSWADPQWKTNF